MLCAKFKRLFLRVRKKTYTFAANKNERLLWLSLTRKVNATAFTFLTFGQMRKSLWLSLNRKAKVVPYS